MLGALVLALPLSACGRKGPLDPPPGGYAFDPGTVRTPSSNLGQRREEERKPQPEYDEQGRPIAPRGPKKKLPGDWLID
jgi:predicted small lipoprotein YifL